MKSEINIKDAVKKEDLRDLAQLTLKDRPSVIALAPDSEGFKAVEKTLNGRADSFIERAKNPPPGAEPGLLVAHVNERANYQDALTKLGIESHDVDLSQQEISRRGKPKPSARVIRNGGFVITHADANGISRSGEALPFSQGRGLNVFADEKSVSSRIAN